VWHLLEGHFELILANAQHIKNVPGRKTDVNDAAWIADLLAHGLIRSSLCRRNRSRSCAILRAPASSWCASSRSISNFLGHSGRAILLALIAEESDPERLANLAQCNARKKRAALIEARHDRVTPHHRELLQLHLQLDNRCNPALPLAEVN
jgi:hypothetical protein